MVGKLTLDKSGRIVLPKPLRDELNLSAGDTLELETSGEQITLHPIRATTPLQKERGIWMIRTGEDLPASVVETQFGKFEMNASASLWAKDREIVSRYLSPSASFSHSSSAPSGQPRSLPALRQE